MNSESVELPIDGTLDLHTFRPQDIGDLIPEFLAACRSRKIYRVRLVHGKGTGALREGVHALLKQLPEVEEFYLGGASSGSWGSTWVILKRDPKS
jgi:DNA-nicking Smr family endonuclease